VYRDIYASLYRWSLKRWHGDEYMASVLTAVVLAGAIVSNCGLVLGVLVLLTGPLPWWPDIVSIVFVALIVLPHLWAFVRNDRYREVLRRFERRPQEERRRITILAWVYLIMSYLIPLIFFFSMAGGDLCSFGGARPHPVIWVICQTIP
jgi:Ca2+/Na+ antiporter